MKWFINIGIIIAFSICYMQWGNNQSSYIFQTEYQLLFKEHSLLKNLTHPIILSGLVGQGILLYATFVKRINPKIYFLGIILLSVVVFMILLAGLLSKNIFQIASTLPFVLLSIMSIIKRKSLFITQE